MKHKWKSRDESIKFKEKYQETENPDADLAGKCESQYLFIDRLCENKSLFDTLLKLSTLMFMKYNHKKGIVVKAKIKVENINFVDKDVNHTSVGGQEFMVTNLCIDTGADLICGQHEFLESNEFGKT